MTESIPPDVGEALVDQVFRLWVNPAIVERRLGLTRADVVNALVVFPSSAVKQCGAASRERLHSQPASWSTSRATCSGERWWLSTM